MTTLLLYVSHGQWVCVWLYKRLYWTSVVFFFCIWIRRMWTSDVIFYFTGRNWETFYNCILVSEESTSNTTDLWAESSNMWFSVFIIMCLETYFNSSKTSLSCSQSAANTETWREVNKHEHLNTFHFGSSS